MGMRFRVHLNLKWLSQTRRTIQQSQIGTITFFLVFVSSRAPIFTEVAAGMLERDKVAFVITSY